MHIFHMYIKKMERRELMRTYIKYVTDAHTMGDKNKILNFYLFYL